MPKSLNGGFTINRFSPIMITYIVLVFCLCLASQALGDKKNEAPAKADILFNNSMLSASLTGVPLSEVLAEIQRQGNVRFYGTESLSKTKIWSDFTNLPLREGIARILANYNRTMVFDGNGKLTQVHIFAKSEEPSRLPTKKTRIAMSPTRYSSSKLPPESGDLPGTTTVEEAPPGAEETDTGTDLEFTPREKMNPPAGEESSEEGFGIKRNVQPPGIDSSEEVAPLTFKGKEKVAPPGM